MEKAFTLDKLNNDISLLELQPLQISSKLICILKIKQNGNKLNRKCSTAWIATARKPFFQANLQIRSLVFDNFQKKNLVKKYLV